jgi:hypothetical protein
VQVGAQREGEAGATSPDRDVRTCCDLPGGPQCATERHLSAGPTVTTSLPRPCPAATVASPSTGGDHVHAAGREQLHHVLADPAAGTVDQHDLPDLGPAHVDESGGRGTGERERGGGGEVQAFRDRGHGPGRQQGVLGESVRASATGTGVDV